MSQKRIRLASWGERPDGRREPGAVEHAAGAVAFVLRFGLEGGGAELVDLPLAVVEVLAVPRRHAAGNAPAGDRGQLLPAAFAMPAPHSPSFETRKATADA